MSDARSTAWANAWALLQGLQKYRAEHPGEEPPQVYWAIIAEATVFAVLAKADPATGFAAGAWMDAVAAEEAAQQQRLKEMMDTLDSREPNAQA